MSWIQSFNQAYPGARAFLQAGGFVPGPSGVRMANPNWGRAQNFGFGAIGPAIGLSPMVYGIPFPGYPSLAEQQKVGVSPAESQQWREVYQAQMRDRGVMANPLPDWCPSSITTKIKGSKWCYDPKTGGWICAEPSGHCDGKESRPGLWRLAMPGRGRLRRRARARLRNPDLRILFPDWLKGTTAAPARSRARTRLRNPGESSQESPWPSSAGYGTGQYGSQYGPNRELNPGRQANGDVVGSCYRYCEQIAEGEGWDPKEYSEAFGECWGNCIVAYTPPPAGSGPALTAPTIPTAPTAPRRKPPRIKRKQAPRKRGAKRATARRAGRLRNPTHKGKCTAHELFNKNCLPYAPGTAAEGCWCPTVRIPPKKTPTPGWRPSITARLASRMRARNPKQSYEPLPFPGQGKIGFRRCPPGQEVCGSSMPGDPAICCDAQGNVVRPGARRARGARARRGGRLRRSRFRTNSTLKASGGRLGNTGHLCAPGACGTHACGDCDPNAYAVPGAVDTVAEAMVQSRDDVDFAMKAANAALRAMYVPGATAWADPSVAILQKPGGPAPVNPMTTAQWPTCARGPAVVADPSSNRQPLQR